MLTSQSGSLALPSELSRLTLALDETRIRISLGRVAKRLKRKTPTSLTPQQLAARRRAIENLEHYRGVEALPRNTYGRSRTPIFRDEQGSLCAVAFLVAATGQGSLVDEVAQRHNFDLVQEMDVPQLEEWAEAHGLTKEELADIQPSYKDGVNLEVVNDLGPEPFDVALLVVSTFVLAWLLALGLRSVPAGKRIFFGLVAGSISVATIFGVWLVAKWSALEDPSALILLTMTATVGAALLMRSVKSKSNAMDDEVRTVK